MFDHVKFGVSDYAASKAFFLKALEPLGVAVVSLRLFDQKEIDSTKHPKKSCSPWSTTKSCRFDK